jgi:hypothetical protein
MLRNMTHMFRILLQFFLFLFFFVEMEISEIVAAHIYFPVNSLCQVHRLVFEEIVTLSGYE